MSILNYHLHFSRYNNLNIFFCRDKRPAYLGIGIMILAALYQGVIKYYRSLGLYLFLLLLPMPILIYS